MSRIFLVIATLLAFGFAQAAASQIDYDNDPVYQAARAAADSGRYDEAFPVIKRVAEAGFAKAQYNLAVLYREGRGTPASPELYRQWMQASAAQELALALFTLGLDYDVGRGVAKDLPRALGYYERSAIAGNPLAAYNAGQIHLLGEGSIPPNRDKAIQFLEKSADAKEARALMTLGYMYETGLTVKKDIKWSRHYYYQAEAAGWPGAAEAIDRMKEAASFAAFDEMVVGNHPAAFELFHQLCDEGDMEACAYYGRYLANGAPGVASSLTASLAPLKKSCAAGELYGCQFQAYAVAKAKFSADEDARYQAAVYFIRRCSGTPAHQESCYNVAVMFYNGTAKGGKEAARKFAAESCSAGYKNSCRMVTEIDAQRQYAIFQQAESDRQAEAFAAGRQSSYSAGVTPSSGSSYSGSSSSSSSSSSSNRTQDNADFNAFINKVNSYNTGYKASCRPGNPYC